MAVPIAIAAVSFFDDKILTPGIPVSRLKINAQGGIASIGIGETIFRYLHYSSVGEK